MRKIKSGLNLVSTPPDFGAIGYYGINQVLKKVMKILKNDFCKKYYRIYIIKMDFEELDFEEIRKHIYIVSPNQPIENVYKSVFESFDKFCQNKKNM